MGQQETKAPLWQMSLKLANWDVRCLTRNPTSSAPLALSALRAEAVQADLSDLSSLFKGFVNINAIFLNINFRDTFRAILQAKPSVGEKSANEAAFNTEILHGKMQPLQQQACHLLNASSTPLFLP